MHLQGDVAEDEVDGPLVPLPLRAPHGACRHKDNQTRATCVEDKRRFDII